MTQPRSLWGALISSFLIALLAFAPTTVWAQDFEFGEEEVEEIPESGQPPADDGGGDDGADMVFDDNDLSKEDATETEEKPSVAVVAITGPNADQDRRQQIQQAMSDYAQSIPTIIAVGPEGALPALQQRDPATCVTKPICLGAVGDEAGVDHLLIGRVKQSDAGMTLEVDYFNVNDRLFMKYHSSEPVSGTGGLVDAVEPAMKDIFNIRDPSDDPNYVGDEDAGIVQDIVAYGAAGLAVVFLGTAIYFGTQVSSAESDLEAQENENGTYNITQQRAQDLVRDAESDATASNIFYGLAAAMAVTSVVFFIIKGGSDVAADQERAELFDDLRFGPTVTESGAGIGAGFSF